MSSRKKTARSIITFFNFVFIVFFTYPEKTRCTPPCLKITCLLHACCLLVLQLAVTNIISLHSVKDSTGWVGWTHGCHWGPASLEWTMHSHLSTLYTLYHVHPTYKCAYNILQREIIFRLICNLKWHKIHFLKWEINCILVKVSSDSHEHDCTFLTHACGISISRSLLDMH